MALNAAIVWECRASGSDNNGGGFKAGASGTDRSQQDSAYATLTTASVVHTTTTQINVDVGDYTVASTDIGNVLQITGGTATAGFYEITAVDTGNNRWTVDRSVGTAAQTVAGAMGGALGTPGKAGGAMASGNSLYIKGSHTITSATANIAGGCLKPNSAGGSLNVYGYGTTRGDGQAATLTLDSGVSSARILESVCYLFAENLVLDGASQTSSIGVYNNSSNSFFLRNIQAQNCASSGFSLGNVTGMLVQCSAVGCVIGFNGGSTQYFIACEASGNTSHGFTGSGCLFACISKNNTGASTDGFTGGLYACVNCIAYGNGRDGFGATDIAAFNCIAEGNGRYGFRTGRSISGITNCASYNNTSGNSVATSKLASITALSGSPFMNAAGDDFTLNNTSGAGASCRALGVPGTFPVLSILGYFDIGIQHQDSGGAAGMLYVPGMEGLG